MEYVPKSKREKRGLTKFESISGQTEEAEELEERLIEAKSALNEQIEKIEKRFKLTVEQTYSLLQALTEEYEPIPGNPCGRGRRKKYPKMRGYE